MKPMFGNAYLHYVLCSILRNALLGHPRSTSLGLGLTWERYQLLHSPNRDPLRKSKARNGPLDTHVARASIFDQLLPIFHLRERFGTHALQFTVTEVRSARQSIYDARVSAEVGSTWNSNQLIYLGSCMKTISVTCDEIFKPRKAQHELVGYRFYGIWTFAHEN